MSALFPVQTGEIVALKKVALRRLEDGIPNQALREIKALQEIEDNQYVSGGPAPPSLPVSILPTLSCLHSLIHPFKRLQDSLPALLTPPIRLPPPYPLVRPFVSACSPSLIQFLTHLLSGLAPSSL